MHYASPSSLTTGSSACEQDICSCFLAAVVCPRTTSKAFQFLGLGCGLSEGGPLPSGVGGVSSKAAAPIFVPSIAVPSRPPRSFWISLIYRSSVPLSLSLSRPHLANDEAHALYHGYACSESTSASLRPKAGTVKSRLFYRLTRSEKLDRSRLPKYEWASEGGKSMAKTTENSIFRTQRKPLSSHSE